MKPSNEEKLRFFGSHIGCEVEFKTQTGSRRGTLIGVTENSYHVKDSKGVVKYIDHELVTILFRPLSSISDEDAIKVAKIVHNDYEGYAEYDDLEKEDGYRFLYEIYGYNETIGLYFKVHLPGTQAHHSKYLKAIQVADYLRSKGYALPWNGHTVEQMISYSWIKLKE